ncbi:MAG TPA: glycosyltransferase family A protein [Planctomycetota bacterium]|nr:glycosyltransferase family A protein [Planctomycetota bacterium]
MTDIANTIRISVVIPTYNYGRFVCEAVDSVLGQTLQPLEIIVVDDGSTDNTAEVLKPYGNRIRYIYQKNEGLSAARNAGILAARGEWIALLDSDDTWEPRKLELQAAFAAAHPEIDLLGTLELTAADSPQLACEAVFITTRDFLGGAPFGPSSVLMRKSRAIEAGLFKVDLRSVEDRDMWLRLSTRGKCARLNTRLWTYRQHSNQMHSNAQRMQESYLRVLNEFFSEFPRERKHRRLAYAWYHFDSAQEYSLGGRTARAIGHLLRSFMLQPWPLPQLCRVRKFNRFILMAKCLLGDKGVGSLLRMLKPRRRSVEQTPQPSPGEVYASQK